MCGWIRDFRFSNPYSFLARQKDVIEEAYPGDVVGLFDTGNFKIGDTLDRRRKFLFYRYSHLFHLKYLKKW